jgi:hypothetical protein
MSSWPITGLDGELVFEAEGAGNCPGFGEGGPGGNDQRHQEHDPGEAALYPADGW